MRLIQAFAAAALSASGATVAHAAPPAPAPGWEAGRFEGTATCFVAREERGGAILVLIAGEGRVWAAVGHPAWRAEEEEGYQVGLEIDGKRRPVKPASGVRSMGMKGFLVEVDRGFLRTLSRGRTIRISPAGGPPTTLSLAGAAGAAARLMRCYNFPSDATWGLAGAGRAAAGPLRDPFRRNRPFPRRAVGTLAHYFAPDDYPAAAIRTGAKGRVDFRAETGLDGRITHCSVVRSSGFAELDAATCAVLVRRARVKPALDSEGKAAPDTIRGTIEWKLGKQALRRPERWR